MNGAKNLNANATIKAIRKFVKGPASETKAISFLGSLKLKGSTGTGFAAPKTTGDPLNKRIRGKRILIIGSMWGIGLSVSLPRSLAVGSPSLFATQP